MSRVRIQKVLAAAGVASRRAAEAMILDGRVEVNGRVVTELPCFVDPAADRIRLDGRPVGKPTKATTAVLLNKPRGVVCTPRDPHARPSVFDLVPPMSGRVYCVGGLDVDSTGLVLLTNDGALANRLNHPRYGVPRTYLVQVDGSLQPQAVDKIAAGVFIDGRRAVPNAVKVRRRDGKRTLLEVQLVESAGREVRPLLIRLGHRSRRLKRTAIGPVTDQSLKVGHFRPLGRGEVRALMGSDTPAGRSRRKPGRR